MRLTDLLGAKLVTESGERLGQVFDVRVKRDPRSSSERADQKWRLDGLLYGGEGLVARFGLFAARERVSRGMHEELPWSDVVAIAAGEITVRDRVSRPPSQ
jgi:sporulation protein YlmC with PRC-barrel domain